MYSTTILSLFVFLPFAALLACSLCVAVYSLYFHPLARYPGPFLARITSLHQTYHAWKGDRHLEFWRCHEKYGNIVRYSPNGLSFNTSTALKDIYSPKANVRKADFYHAFPATKGAVSIHSAIDKAVHARKRRVLSHAFSDAAIKSMENHILAHVRQFCANLGQSAFPSYQVDEKDWTPAKNMSDQTSWMTFDVMGDLCFGKPFGMLERPDNRYAVNLVQNASHRHLICGTYLPIHKYHIDKLLLPKIAGMRQRYMQFSKAQAAERTKMGLDVDRKDLFYHLLSATEPETGQGLSTTELWGESNFLIIAGSDTTSTVLSASIFYLVHNPKTLETLTREVRNAFSDVEEIRIDTRSSGLPYLRACIDEAMRLSPPAGGLFPRQALTGGIEVDGIELPEGTDVGLCTYAIQHNPMYYPEPFEYKPERWIVGSEPSMTTESVSLAQSAFCPFSIGPRGCIAKGMAYAELTTALARVVYTYDMRLSPGTNVGGGSLHSEFGRHRPKEFQLMDKFISSKDGPLVEFRLRA